MKSLKKSNKLDIVSVSEYILIFSWKEIVKKMLFVFLSLLAFSPYMWYKSYFELLYPGAKFIFIVLTRIALVLLLENFLWVL